MFEFNVSQSLGLDINRHIAIDAGAGTGRQRSWQVDICFLSADQRATRILPWSPRIPLMGMGAIRYHQERTDLKE